MSPFSIWGLLSFFRNADEKNGHNIRRKRAHAQRQFFRPAPDLSSVFIRLPILNMETGSQTRIRYLR